MFSTVSKIDDTLFTSVLSTSLNLIWPFTNQQDCMSLREPMVRIIVKLALVRSS